MTSAPSPRPRPERPADRRQATPLDGYAHPGGLEGFGVRLEPLATEHEAGIAEALADGELWTHWYTRIPSIDALPGEIARRLAEQQAGRMLPFTIREASPRPGSRAESTPGRILGQTTYFALRPEARRLEIGYTWMRESAQGTSVNPAIKYLMLRHAFEVYGCLAVELRTSGDNRHSQAAIAKLGAHRDGVLRQHDIMPDGYLRDVVVFSILDTEWPRVRAGLEERLAAAGLEA